MFSKLFNFNLFKKKEVEKQEEIIYEKPYLKLMFQNNVIIAILNNGDVVTANKSMEDFINARNVSTEKELLEILKEPEQISQNGSDKDIDLKTNLIDHNEEILELLNDERFTHSSSNFYYNNISLPIPPIVLNSLIKLKSEEKSAEFEAMICFFLKLALNPIEESRNDLLKAIENSNSKLTPSGNFLGWRRIVKVGVHPDDYVNFISENYFKLKKQKKSVSNKIVFRNENGGLYIETVNIVNGKPHYNKFDFKSEIVGILKDLYLDLSKQEENLYTDNHSHTKQIKIGEVYKIDESEISLDSRGSCGNSLHLSLGKAFYNYDDFGDTDVIVIVNPTHVYKMDTGYIGKIGVKEMFIACKGTELDVTEELIHFDEIYHNESMEQLEKAVSEKSFKNYTIDLEYPLLSITDMPKVNHSLQEILKQRIVNI